MKQWSGRFEIDKSVEGLPIIPQMTPRAKKGWIRVRQQTLFLLLKASNFHLPKRGFHARRLEQYRHPEQLQSCTENQNHKPDQTTVSNLLSPLYHPYNLSISLPLNRTPGPFKNVNDEKNSAYAIAVERRRIIQCQVVASKTAVIPTCRT